MANGSRVQKVIEDMFNEVKLLIKRFPNATNKEIGKLVQCPGGLSETTVSKIRNCDTYLDFVNLNTKKSQKAKEKQTDDPVEKYRISDPIADYDKSEFIPLSKVSQDEKNNRIAELLMQIVEILKE